MCLWIGSQVLVNGDEFEKIDVLRSDGLRQCDSDATNNNIVYATTNEKISVRIDDESGVAEASNESGEMMRELVRSKELLAGPLPPALACKRGSIDSDASSETSALVSTTVSELGIDYLASSCIRHEVIRAAISDSEVERPSKPFFILMVRVGGVSAVHD